MDRSQRRTIARPRAGSLAAAAPQPHGPQTVLRSQARAKLHVCQSEHHPREWRGVRSGHIGAAVYLVAQGRVSANAVACDGPGISQLDLDDAANLRDRNIVGATLKRILCALSDLTASTRSTTSRSCIWFSFCRRPSTGRRRARCRCRLACPSSPRSFLIAWPTGRL